MGPMQIIWTSIQSQCASICALLALFVKGQKLNSVQLFVCYAVIIVQISLWSLGFLRLLLGWNVLNDHMKDRMTKAVQYESIMKQEISQAIFWGT